MAKKTRWAEVTCDTHGKYEDGSQWKRKQVTVSIPKHKRDRMSGCPVCKKLEISLVK